MFSSNPFGFFAGTVAEARFQTTRRASNPLLPGFHAQAATDLDMLNQPCPSGRIVPFTFPNISGSGAVKIRKSPASRNLHSTRFPFTVHRPACFVDHSFSAHDTPPAASNRNTPFQSPIDTIHFPLS